MIKSKILTHRIDQSKVGQQNEMQQLKDRAVMQASVDRSYIAELSDDDDFERSPLASQPDTHATAAFPSGTFKGMLDSQ